MVLLPSVRLQPWELILGASIPPQAIDPFLASTHPLPMIPPHLAVPPARGPADVPSVLERLASFPTALPVSLQLSLLRVVFAMPSRCSPLKFFVPGASLLSLELPRLPRSFAVFPGVPQSSPEFSSLCWSSSLSTGVPATSLEPLSLGVLRRFFVRLPLSSKSFPVVSYDAAIAS